MKRLFLAVALAITASSAHQELQAALRTVLIEEATNIGCGCAASLNPGLDSILAYYGHVDLVSIRYHGWIPLESDPFYLQNPSEVEDRYSYYAIGKIPSLVIDGVLIPRTCTAYNPTEKIKERTQIESPIRILVSESWSEDSCRLDVKIITEDEPPSDSLVLRVAVIEDSIIYQAPNGENLFNNVFRKFVGGSAGFVFEPVLGETLSFDLGFAIDPSWEAQNISSVVFIENDSDKSIIQAASSKSRPQAWARYTAEKQGKVERLGLPVSFPGRIINRGSLTDTFDVDLFPDLPSGWSAHVDFLGGSLANGGVELESDSSCTTILNIETSGEPGTGYVTVDVRSRRMPGFERSLDFLVAAGICGLIVDDDGGEDIETYFGTALDSIGILWGRWDRSVGAPTIGDLNLCGFVIWFTGSHIPTLNQSDRQVLSAYLSGGGRLFVTGQDIGYDLCDIISPNYSSESESFYRDYLHAEYIRSNSLLFEVAGRSEDPISDGLSFSIEGGDGANNQAFPDVIDAIYPAIVIFDYSDPEKHAGIRFESDSSKVVYLSFGFEAISSFDDRVALLSRIIDWFGGLSGIGSVSDVSGVRIYPNPATTHLSIETFQSRFEGIMIYDVLGRLVRVLDPSPNRETSLDWDLRDYHGIRVAPGIYFVTMKVSDKTFQSKVIITR